MEEGGYAWPVRLHLCGVRGSTPVSGPNFVRYGGPTSCLVVADDDASPTLILDAGTDQIAKRFARAPLPVTVAAEDQVIDL
jgi:phosphoribosyl 1,2-cyclic phosphodiesterase